MTVFLSKVQAYHNEGENKEIVCRDSVVVSGKTHPDGNNCFPSRLTSLWRRIFSQIHVILSLSFYILFFKFFCLCMRVRVYLWVFCVCVFHILLFNSWLISHKSRFWQKDFCPFFYSIERHDPQSRPRGNDRWHWSEIARSAHPIRNHSHLWDWICCRSRGSGDTEIKM